MMLRLSAIQAVAKARADLENAEKGIDLAPPAPRTIPLEEYYNAADSEIEVLLEDQREQFERFKLVLEHEARQQEREQREKVVYRRGSLAGGGGEGEDGLGVYVPAATSELLTNLSDHLPSYQRERILSAADGGSNSNDNTDSKSTGGDNNNNNANMRRKQIAQALLSGGESGGGGVHASPLLKGNNTGISQEALSALRSHTNSAKAPVPRHEDGGRTTKKGGGGGGQQQGWGSGSSGKIPGSASGSPPQPSSPTRGRGGGGGDEDNNNKSAIVEGASGDEERPSSSLRFRFRSEKEQRLFLLSKMKDPILGERLRVVPNPYKIRRDEEEAKRREEIKERQLAQALAQTRMTKTYKSFTFSPKKQRRGGEGGGFSSADEDDGESSSSNYDYDDFYLDENGHCRGANATAAAAASSTSPLRLTSSHSRFAQLAPSALVPLRRFSVAGSEQDRDSEAEHRLKPRTLKLLKPLSFEQAGRERNQYHVLEDTLKMLQTLKPSGNVLLAPTTTSIILPQRHADDEDVSSANVKRTLILEDSKTEVSSSSSSSSMDDLSFLRGSARHIVDVCGATRHQTKKKGCTPKATPTTASSSTVKKSDRDDDDVATRRRAMLAKWHGSRDEHLHEQHRHQVDKKVVSSVQQAAIYQQHRALETKLKAIHARAAALDEKRKGDAGLLAKVPTAAELEAIRVAAKNRFALGEISTMEEYARSRMVAEERSTFAMYLQLPFDEELGLLRPRRNLLPPIPTAVTSSHLLTTHRDTHPLEDVSSGSFNVSGALEAFGNATAEFGWVQPPPFTSPSPIDDSTSARRSSRHARQSGVSITAVSPRAAAAKRGSIFAPKGNSGDYQHSGGGVSARRFSMQQPLVTGLLHAWDANTAAIVTPAAAAASRSRRGSDVKDQQHSSIGGGILQPRNSIAGPNATSTHPRSRRPSVTVPVHATNSGVTLLSVLDVGGGQMGGGWDSGRRGSHESANSSGGSHTSSLYVEALANLAPLPAPTDTVSSVPMSIRTWETNFFNAPTPQVAFDAVLRTQGIMPSSISDMEAVANSARRLSVQPLPIGITVGGSNLPQRRDNNNNRRPSLATGGVAAAAMATSPKIGASSLSSVGAAQRSAPSSLRGRGGPSPGHFSRQLSPTSNLSYGAAGTPGGAGSYQRSVSSGGFSGGGHHLVTMPSPRWSESQGDLPFGSMVNPNSTPGISPHHHNGGSEVMPPLGFHAPRVTTSITTSPSPKRVVPTTTTTPMTHHQYQHGGGRAIQLPSASPLGTRGGTNTATTGLVGTSTSQSPSMSPLALAHRK